MPSLPICSGRRGVILTWESRNLCNLICFVGHVIVVAYSSFPGDLAMDVRNWCLGCGEERPSDAPSGLCPACLIKAGLPGDGSELHEMTITFGPASSSVLASLGQAFGNIPPILLRDADSVTDPDQVIRPSSSEIPNPADRSARLQLFGEIARGGMGVLGSRIRSWSRSGGEGFTRFASR